MTMPDERPLRSAQRLLLAPFEMKGALRAAEVAAIMERVLEDRFGSVTRRLPLGDGGPGTLEALAASLPDLELREAHVQDALGRRVPARFGLRRAVSSMEVPTRPVWAWIEAAEAHGHFRLTPSERSAVDATSRGVGQLIVAALDAGATELWIGLGGSASNDGGAGALEALGARMLDAQGRPLASGGAALSQLARVELSDLDPRLSSSRITVACDVMAPLLGPLGASRLFGPQKGATPEDVDRLEEGLGRLDQVLGAQRPDVAARTPGTGAAGGLGYGLMVGLGAGVRTGLDAIAELVGLPSALEWADGVLTAEGCLDAQSLLGKGPVRLAQWAAERSVPTVAFVGRAEVEAPMFREVIEAPAQVPSVPASARAALEQALSRWRP